MAVIAPLRRVPEVLREQPVLFVPIALFALLQIPQMYIEVLEPTLSLIFSLLFMGVFLFLTPLFYAGIIGMADDATQNRQTSLSRFWSHTKKNYISVLIAYLIVFAIISGLGIVVFIAFFIGFFAIGTMVDGLLGLGLVAVTGLVFVVAFIALVLALQFYAHAIVIENEGAIGGLTRSVQVVRSNVTAAIGYGILVFGSGAVIGGIYSVLMQFMLPTAATGDSASTPDLVPVLLGTSGTVLLTVFFGAVFAVYSVGFYKELTAERTQQRNDSTDALSTSSD